MDSPKIITFWVTLLFLIPYPAIPASDFDTFVFQDGKKRTGTLLEERADGFAIRTSTGKAAFVSKHRITRILNAKGEVVYPKPKPKEEEWDDFVTGSKAAKPPVPPAKGKAKTFEKANIAVMEMEGNGVSASDIAGLSNRLRSELFKTGKFTVIERSRMNDILKEQGFQQTGCTNTECAVEIGQLMGVERIVVGSVDKVGTVYTADVRMVDVGTGEIGQAVTEDCRGCSIDDVILTTIRNAARKMAGMKPLKAEPRVAQLQPLPAGPTDKPGVRPRIEFVRGWWNQTYRRGDEEFVGNGGAGSLKMLGYVKGCAEAEEYVYRWRRANVRGWLLVASGVGISLIGAALGGGDFNAFDNPTSISVWSVGMVVNAIGTVTLFTMDKNIRYSANAYNRCVETSQIK